MGEREDILRRFAERVRDGRWAVDTGYKSVHQAARAALREADALPPDDAQQRLDQIRDLAEEAKGPRGAPLTALGRIARLARGGYKS
jgi:hypothetical protein